MKGREEEYFNPLFLFYEFLNNDGYSQIQNRHLYEGNKMRSDHHLIEDIDSELHFEICRKNLFY